MRRDGRKKTNISLIQWWRDSAENLDRQAPFAKIFRALVKNSWSYAFATLTSCLPLLEVYNWPSTNASSSSKNIAGTARPWRGRIAILTAVISYRKVMTFQQCHEFTDHIPLVFSFSFWFFSRLHFLQKYFPGKSPFHITGYTILYIQSETHSICGEKDDDYHHWCIAFIRCDNLIPPHSFHYYWLDFFLAISTSVVQVSVEPPKLQLFDEREEQDVNRLTIRRKALTTRIK